MLRLWRVPICLVHCLDLCFLFNGSRGLGQKSFLPCAVACEGERCSFFVYSPENTYVGHLVLVMLIELVKFLPYFWRQLSPPRHVRVFDVYARVTKVFFLALSTFGGCFEYWRAWYFGAWCLSYTRKRAINCPEMALSCVYITCRCTFKCWVFLRTVQSVFCFFLPLLSRRVRQAKLKHVPDESKRSMLGQREKREVRVLVRFCWTPEPRAFGAC